MVECDAEIIMGIDVLNVFCVFYSGHVFNVLNFFGSTFFLFKKRCQMQGMNIQKSNENTL